MVTGGTRSPGADSILHVGDIQPPLTSMALLTGQALHDLESLSPDTAPLLDRLCDPWATPSSWSNARQATNDRLRISSHEKASLGWLVGGCDTNQDADQ